MDVVGFREAFPAFTAELHPDARVAFHLRMAGLRLPSDRWGELLEDGTGLFVAHHLTLEAKMNQATDGTGGMDAAAGTLASESKTVGPVSKSKAYTNAATAEPGAGHWNATIYGQQFRDLARIVGMGGLQL
ncbi:DUF4054 domain-containing protein [Pseudodesulfovibrio sp.]|uniref:DUF4054 domain-containing protein n=1 Tax=Pseudodesulfovibrio sp. TaxID=2035812 RepID=UPI00263647ED|nr:DUF4054 domain-containing protein [Pseudodesulfovibrio sp.]MDD3310957.1 DUF4054 domain-containing protein [Pseudodesulfovibrio sp.]